MGNDFFDFQIQNYFDKFSVDIYMFKVVVKTCTKTHDSITITKCGKF